jgi:alpha-galactosidase
MSSNSDNCNIPSNWTDQYVACDPDAVTTGPNGTCSTALDPTLAPPGYDWSTSNSAVRFNRMRDALASQTHEIVLSCASGARPMSSLGATRPVSAGV